MMSGKSVTQVNEEKLTQFHAYASRWLSRCIKTYSAQKPAKSLISVVSRTGFEPVTH